MSKVLDVHATIRDLNGNHISLNNPIPILRRTSSGHLFQPRNDVVKASEMVIPIPVMPDEIVTLRRVSIREVEVVRAEKQKRNSAAKQRVRFQTSIAEESSNGTSSMQCKSRLVVEDVIAHDCRLEEDGHRCIIKNLFDVAWPDIVTFQQTDGMVRAEQKHSSSAGYETDDIWAQIACEQ